MKLARLLPLFLILTFTLSAEDGYRLWLRYDPIPDESLRRAYAGAISEIVVPEGNRPLVTSARDELAAGLRGLLGAGVPVVTAASRDNALILGTPRDPWIASVISEADL